MAAYLKSWFHSNVRHHLDHANILKQMLEWFRDQIQQAMSEKQILIDNFEQNAGNVDRHLGKELLIQEQAKNQAFLNTVNSIIDYLQLNINNQTETLGETVQYEVDDETGDDDDDDDDDD